MAVWTAEQLKAIADSYLAENFRHEKSAQVKELALRLTVSPAEFGKLFAIVTGERASDYLRGRQIERAKDLLLNSQFSLNAVAYKSGFGTRTTFFRAFKRLTGMTPREFQGRARKG